MLPAEILCNLVFHFADVGTLTDVHFFSYTCKRLHALVENNKARVLAALLVARMRMLAEGSQMYRKNLARHFVEPFVWKNPHLFDIREVGKENPVWERVGGWSVLVAALVLGNIESILKEEEKPFRLSPSPQATLIELEQTFEFFAAKVTATLAPPFAVDAAQNGIHHLPLPYLQRTFHVLNSLQSFTDLAKKHIKAVGFSESRQTHVPSSIPFLEAEHRKGTRDNTEA